MRGGGRVDIEHYVEHYADYLYHMAYMYTKDRFVAEEIVQDVFVKFYQSQQFKGKASAKTYLTKMVINKCYDYLRKEKVKRLVTLEIFQTTSKSTEFQLIEQYEQDEIIAVILTLPVKYREVIFLYYYEQLSAVDIATMLHVSASTVRTRLQRAREKLKSSLSETDWEVLKHE